MSGSPNPNAWLDGISNAPGSGFNTGTNNTGNTTGARFTGTDTNSQNTAYPPVNVGRAGIAAAIVLAAALVCCAGSGHLGWIKKQIVWPGPSKSPIANTAPPVQSYSGIQTPTNAPIIQYVPVPTAPPSIGYFGYYGGNTIVTNEGPSNRFGIGGWSVCVWDCGGPNRGGWGIHRGGGNWHPAPGSGGHGKK